MKQSEPCRKCGQWAGWQELWIERRSYHYHEDGTPNGASDTDPVRGGKVKLCDNCHAIITKTITEGS